MDVADYARRACARLHRSGAGLVLWCALVTPAAAVDYTWKPEVQMLFRAEDNVTVAAQNPQSVYGVESSAGIGLGAAAETWTSTLSSKFNQRRFVSGADLDADEYSARAGHEVGFGQGSAALEVSYARDSTLTTEATDTGLRSDVKDRDTVTVAPRVRYRLDDRWSLEANYLFSDVGFVQAETSGLVDYRYMVGSVRAARALNASDRVFASYFVSDFRTPDRGGGSFTHGGEGGIGVALGPTFDAELSAGLIAATTETVEQGLDIVVVPVPRLVLVRRVASDTLVSPIASAVIHGRFAQGTARLEYARRTSPTTRGKESESDRIEFVAQRDLNRRWALIFDGVWDSRRSDAQEDVGGLDRDLLALIGSVRYRLSEYTTVKANYRFLWRHSAAAGESVAAHGVFVYLSFDSPANTLFGWYR